MSVFFYYLREVMCSDKLMCTSGIAQIMLKMRTFFFTLVSYRLRWIGETVLLATAGLFAEEAVVENQDYLLTYTSRSLPALEVWRPATDLGKHRASNAAGVVRAGVALKKNSRRRRGDACCV